MIKEDLLTEATIKFPDAVSTVEAVDNYAVLIYKELAEFKDKESEQYYSLALKYRHLRQLHKKLYMQKIEEESAYQRV
jgi:hypothetical protein